MRITNNTTADQVIAGIQSNLSRVSELQVQLSSGKKFQKGSDNPVDMARIMRLQQQINKDTQYEKNLDNLKPNLQMTESTLGDIVNRIQSVMQLTKTYQNSAIQSSNNELLATNIDSIRGNIIDLANSSYNGRYIFGGYNTTTKPFELLPDGRIKNRGTDDILTTQITDTESIDLSLKGTDLFVAHSVLGNTGLGSKTLPIAGLTTNSFTISVGSDAPITIMVGTGTGDVSLQGVADAINASGSMARAYIKETPEGARLKIVSSYIGQDGELILSDAAPGGVLEHLGLLNNAGTIVGVESNIHAGLLDTLGSVSNKMKAGTPNISDEITDINVAYQNILKNQGQMAVLTQNADNHANMMADMAIKREELLSAIWNVDMIEVASSLSRETSAYQASIQAGAKIVMPTLLDYMR